jgi:2-dehydro-3-deoxy-D-arabinonate dehydratase
MKLYKTKKGFVINEADNFYISNFNNWDQFINRKNLFECLVSEIPNLEKIDDFRENWLAEILAPIQNQEVWASGVTYLRSKNARMEESKESGGDTFYDKVYEAPRPELFFKATPKRVVGPNENIRIRKDSAWNVPEPELTLFINSAGQLTGYTVGNDVSSRDIEGENPLYLPQAKTYDKSAALGPCILVLNQSIDPNTKINLQISRNQKLVFDQSIEINQIKRPFSELVEYLYRECSFEHGCFLMTGTGIVPEDNFSLEIGDSVSISIEGIGTLTNNVETK